MFAAFSLVEVTLALGIAAVGLTAVFGLLPIAAKSNRDASAQTAASEILSAVVADLRATPKTSTTSPQYAINFGASTKLYLNAVGKPSSSLQLDSIYQLSVTFSSTPDVGLVYADVSVTWPATAGQQKATGSAETLAIINRN